MRERGELKICGLCALLFLFTPYIFGPPLQSCMHVALYSIVGGEATLRTVASAPTGVRECLCLTFGNLHCLVAIGSS